MEVNASQYWFPDDLSPTTLNATHYLGSRSRLQSSWESDGRKDNGRTREVIIFLSNSVPVPLKLQWTGFSFTTQAQSYRGRMRGEYSP